MIWHNYSINSCFLSPAAIYIVAGDFFLKPSDYTLFRGYQVEDQKNF
ncbi:hypothetical protein HMPREF3187_01802 [Aerococcus christensenii]|uniref:Uncharacterized protein n=1 Tax=Aerococcus christensenii TaxID=87541 RepID=A0A133XPC6_9LACT|nr:hypothetical protein HMPREF3187_01802 [Aerococcus christensenii]